MCVPHTWRPDGKPDGNIVAHSSIQQHTVAYPKSTKCVAHAWGARAELLHAMRIRTVHPLRAAALHVEETELSFVAVQLQRRRRC